VISSSQDLYVNTEKRGHIKHPCPRRDSNPQSRPPSDRKLFMPQTATGDWFLEYKKILTACVCRVEQNYDYEQGIRENVKGNGHDLL
jgi:hypothetical protein